MAFTPREYSARTTVPMGLSSLGCPFGGITTEELCRLPPVCSRFSAAGATTQGTNESSGDGDVAVTRLTVMLKASGMLFQQFKQTLEAAIESDGGDLARDIATLFGIAQVLFCVSIVGNSCHF